MIGYRDKINGKKPAKNRLSLKISWMKARRPKAACYQLSDAEDTKMLILYIVLCFCMPCTIEKFYILNNIKRKRCKISYLD